MWIHLCVAGKGEGRGSCYSLGNLRRRGSFVWKLLLSAAAFVMTFFSLFSGGPLWCKELMAFWCLPIQVGDWSVGAVFPHWCERTLLDYSTLMLWERRLQMTLFLFFHTKTVGIASSWLSQSIGIYSSGHLLQIWGHWSKWTMGHRVVMVVSLPTYVNIWYQ